MKPKTRKDFDTDCQYETYKELIKASKKFRQAVVSYRESFPFTTWKGDAYILGGWLAGLFDPDRWSDAWEAIEDGFNDACEKLRLTNE